MYDTAVLYIHRWDPEDGMIKDTSLRLIERFYKVFPFKKLFLTNTFYTASNVTLYIKMMLQLRYQL